MRQIANNTTAIEEVINRYQKFKNARLFPCDEDRGEKIDLIYIDNGCRETFTLKSDIRNYDESIFLKDGEMTLNENTYLEQLDI